MMVSFAPIQVYHDARRIFDENPKATCPAQVSPSTQLAYIASRATVVPNAGKVGTLLAQIDNDGARGRVAAAFHAAMVKKGLVQNGSLLAMSDRQQDLVGVLISASEHAGVIG